MPIDPEKKIRAAVRRAQVDFERAQSQRDKSSAIRRENFERAQAAGLSIREIAKETGLHFSRVAEILQGK